MRYTPIELNGITIFISRVKHARNFNLFVKNDCNAYATYPWYSSKKELIEYLYTKLEWITKMQKKMSEKTQNHVERIDKSTLAKTIAFYIDKYIPLFREVGYDVSIKRVSIRHMTTRFGSCTPSSRTIRFSTELCKCTDKFIEYVVVHELSHIIEANHSKRFWTIVKNFIPEYKKIDKW